MDLHGVGPVVAARTLADVGDIARFADRNRFASWTGTAPLDASSGEQNRHRLSRAGNRRMNHMIHIAAISQIRLDTDGRAYYRRKRAAGKTTLEALRCLKRRISDALYRQPSPTPNKHDSSARSSRLARAREGTAGRLKNPARSTCPRTSTLRISHFPDPRNRRYKPKRQSGRAPGERALNRPLTTKGSRNVAATTTSSAVGSSALSALHGRRRPRRRLRRRPALPGARESRGVARRFQRFRHRCSGAGRGHRAQRRVGG